jgi:ribonucleoside-diphosphate reductase alpha chain
MGCKIFKDWCDDFGITENKELTPKVEKTSSVFYQGFLSGMFDGDGTVIFNKEKGSSIRLAQNNLQRLETIQRMLMRFGIASTIYKNRNKEEQDLMPDGKGGHKYYNRQPMHELVISKDNISLFRTFIGFKNTRKSKRLEQIVNSYTRTPYVDSFITYVTNIKHIGMKQVYDTQVDEVHSFDANGMLVHNCSESNLLHNEACVLGSINLVKHMTEDMQDMDWDRLADTTKLATRFLDDMVDASPYPTKEVEAMVKSTRKIGVGIMGFADVLIHMNIKYSSKQAVTMAGKIMQFVNDVADHESISLGKEKGLYKEYKPTYRKRRNAITTVIAPTGTLSLIAGVSPGVEPNFYKEYTRVVDDKIIRVTHPLREYEVFESCTEIAPQQHLKILAEFQKHTENSVSKTINVPENTSVEDIKKLIMQAHKMNVKGITVLRDNSSREALIKCAECEI